MSQQASPFAHWVNRPIVGQRCNRHGCALLGNSDVLQCALLPCAECYAGSSTILPERFEHAYDAQFPLRHAVVRSVEVDWVAFDVESYLGTDGLPTVVHAQAPQAYGRAWAWRVMPYQGDFDACELITKQNCRELGVQPLVPRVGRSGLVSIEDLRRQAGGE